MKPESLGPNENHPLSDAPTAKGTRKQWSFFAVALAFILAANPSAQAQTFSLLHSFTGGADGKYPNGPLAQDAAGNLYGTTFTGGDISCVVGYVFIGCGTVFRLDTNGRETVLYSFTNKADGGLPAAGVILDEAGNLYGTTSVGGDPSCNGGGDGGCGTVFKLDTTGKLTVLHSFTGGADGWGPPSGLIRDTAGNLYGTASQGGDLSCPDAYGEIGFGCGTVFKLDATGQFTVLYTFIGSLNGGTNAVQPGGHLIRGPKGTLYGIAGGGAFQCPQDGDVPSIGCGTVYRLDATGSETVLHNFTDGADGAGPSSLIRDWAGNLYGTALDGGIYTYPCASSDGFSYGCGTLFKLDTIGNFTALYSFTGGAEGNWPSGLIRDKAGNFYGTAESGGDSVRSSGCVCGTVFKMDATGNVTVLHTFHGNPDGAVPSGGVILSPEGNFYGTAYSGGKYSSGTAFKIHR